MKGIAIAGATAGRFSMGLLIPVLALIAWQVIGSVMVGAVLVVLMVICLGLFFTGLWVWSLLI